MLMIRLAVVQVSPKPSCRIDNFDKFKVDGVTVCCQNQQEKNGEHHYMFLASIPISPPPIQNGKCTVPEKERILCESALEYTANCISVYARQRRKIVSPPDPVAFIYEDGDDTSYFDGVEPMNQSFIIKEIHSFDPFTNFYMFNALTDRKEGLSLMAEALSHKTGSGEYRDYVRLFENAFSRSTSQLSKKLYQFLDPNMGYTRQEIQGWFNYRDGISHADLNISGKVILESDIRPYLGRMRQASFDVLFNKEDWGTPSNKRRDMWKTGAMSKAPGKNPVATPGSRINSLLTDAYGIFEYDGTWGISEAPPYWWPKPRDRKKID